MPAARDPEEMWATLGDDAPAIKIKCQSSFQARIRSSEHWTWTTMLIRREVYGMKELDEESGTFIPYKVPHTWFTPLTVKEETTKVNCARCGKKIQYWMGHPSTRIVSYDGRPYTVCSACYGKESTK